MTSTNEHLEHAEHAQHAAHDPFDRKVAVTMAIVAACLATITMLSHREHTETIRLQAEANVYQTKASDQWAFYQAKNIRRHEYEALSQLLQVVAKDPEQQAAAKKTQEEWAKYIKRYQEKDLPEIMGQAKELENQAREFEHRSHLSHDKTNRFDGGELGIELALVFCSLSVLTKRPGWWYSSMLLCGCGLAYGLSAFWMAHAASTGH